MPPSSGLSSAPFWWVACRRCAAPRRLLQPTPLLAVGCCVQSAAPFLGRCVGPPPGCTLRSQPLTHAHLVRIPPQGGALMLHYGRRKAIAIDSAFFIVGPLIMAASAGVA